MEQYHTADFFEELSKEELATLFPLNQTLSPFEEKVKRLSLSRLFLTPAELKKALILSSLFSLYSPILPKKGDLLLLFTLVYWDGLGDFIAQIDAAEIIKKKFPDLEIALVTLVKEGSPLLKPSEYFSPIYLSYKVKGEKNILYETFPPSVLELMKKAFLILQFPTFYPHTEQLFSDLSNTHKEDPLPSFEVIEEGGFYPRRGIDPKIKAHAMGLHFFEKGFLMKEIPPASIQDLPSHLHFPFHLAYTRSVRGMALFLHSLFRSKEKQNEEINLLFFKIGHLLSALQNHFEIEKKEKSLLVKLGIQRIEIYLKNSKKVELSLGTRGKLVRFFHEEKVTHKEFLTFLSLASPWIACTGDLSLFESLSAKKLFFYDLPPHKEQMFSDLIDFMKENLKNYPESIELLECFRSKEDPVLLGEKIGRLLKETKVAEGIEKLSSLICEKHSINEFLFQTISRALCHHRYPHMKKVEETHLLSFCHKKNSLQETLREIKSKIHL